MSSVFLFQEILKTNRLLLKKHSVDNAKTMFELINTERERLKLFLPWVDFIKSSQDEYNYILKTHKEWNEEIGYDYSIFDCENNFLGCIRIFDIDKNISQCELGFWLLQKAEGKAYMQEIISFLEDYLFNIGFLRINISTAKNNNRCINLVNKLSYKKDIDKKLDTFLFYKNSI